jgi:hypothetical protein
MRQGRSQDVVERDHLEDRLVWIDIAKASDGPSVRSTNVVQRSQSLPGHSEA